MASSLTAQKLTANVQQKMFFHDPGDATVATKISWQSIAGLKSVLIAAMVASAHAMVTFKIFAATDSDGTGATSVVEHATPTTADAAGDVLYLEATIEQIKDVLATATHVSAEVDMSDAAALAAVTYTMDTDRNYKDQTADQIA